MINVIFFVGGILFGAIIASLFLLRISYKIIDLKNIRINKFNLYFELYDSWLWLKENNIGVEKYFVQNNVYNIAIYGAGKVAKHLIAELQDSKINIKCLIDNKVGESKDFPVYSLKESLPDVDCIIITASFDYENIKREINSKTDIRVVLIDDILHELIA